MQQTSPDILQKRIYDVAAQELEQLNHCIITELHSDVGMVEEIGQYIVAAGGKRLRPLLALLSAKCCGYQGDLHIKLAAIIEFLHTATLLHDDVVDVSDLRRGRKTVNARWGNAPSVLVGDFIYTRSFQLMVSLGDMEIMHILAKASNLLAEGEVMQLARAGDAATSEEQYFEVIRRKTGTLFEAASHTAAVLAGAATEQEKALKAFGAHLGMAYQLVDDVLDYDGDEQQMGKSLGDDLAEGKPTLPLIYTMKMGGRDDASLVENAIREGNIKNLQQIIEAVNRSGGIEYARTKAFEQRDKAIDCMTQFDNSPYKSAILNLAEFSVCRAY